jgi:pimeloyl-ACP methyl ester carboxylesterase
MRFEAMMNEELGGDPDTLVAQLEASAERRMTPCGDGDMVWRIWGDGPALVLLHGGHGAWTHWIRNIPDLAARYRLYVPDLPGYGESGTPMEPHIAENLGEIVANGVNLVLPSETPCAMVGFSLGGIIGGSAAALLGPRVHTFVVIGSSGLDLPRVNIGGLQKWTPDMPEAALRDVHRQNLATIMVADPSNIDALALQLQMSNTLKARVKGSAIARSDSLRRALPAIKARLVCISGASDVYVVDSVDERMALFRAVQPDTPFHFIDSAGHWVMYEQAEAFNSTLDQALRAVAPGSVSA